ncbi:MAG: fibronectin type III domain-containing protein, partial [Bacteroidia bacterium]
MTKKIILIFMAALCSVNSYSQTYRSCATTEVHEEELRNNPEIKQKLLSIENHIQFYEQSGGSMRSMAITIPVVVHIIYNTASQNISDAQIQSQIDVLNEDFRKLNSDVSMVPSIWQGITADAQIEFCLAKRDPMGNATTGITRTYTSQTSFSTNNAMKYTSSGGKDGWDRNQYMNIWVCNLGGSLAGYAQFPGGTAATDGIVVHYSTFGRTGTLQNGYNKGRVTTHEVGHWLNLRHIWGDASCGNDYVADTPTQSAANYGCPGFPYVTCSNGPSGDMYMNYMDYTFDACKYMFTSGQASRMNAVLSPGGYRSSLSISQGCVPPGSTSTCNVPTGLTAPVGNTTATLSWTGTGAVSYTVRYKQLSSSSWITINSTQSSASLSGLTSGVTYEFQVQSNCSSSSSLFSSSATFTTSSSICNVPTGLTASVGTNSATLSWTGTGAVSYTVRYKQLSSSSWITINSTQTSASLSGLTSGVTYEFQVRSNCSSSSSSFSNSATFTTNVSICNTPTGLSVINITTSFVTVSWTSNGSVSYVVRYKPVSSGTWSSMSTTLTSLSIGGLTAGVNYEVQVQGICSSSSSAFSSSVNFTIPIVCNIPSGLVAANITTSSSTLSWNSTGATSYNVKYKPTTSSIWTSLNTTQTTVYISGLSSGTSYEIQVQSVCSSVLSAFSETGTFTTSVITCSIPTGLYASNVTLTTATISWNNTGAVSYSIRYKSISSNLWSYISSSQTTVSIGGLTSGVSYEFQVQSVCGAVSSAYSASVTFATLLPDCIIPSGLAVNNITTTSAQLSWINSGADSYNVRYKVTSSTNWNNLITSQTSISISGLASGNNYEFQVQGVCGFKLSNYSNSFNFFTTAVCNIPGNLSVSNITTSSALLSWSNTGATSYNIRYKATSTSIWINVSTSQTSISISGLASGVDYEFQVQGLCGTINSFYSESAIFATTVTNCVIPSGLSANNITTSTATLQWNSTGASSYNIRYKDLSSVTWSNINTSQTTVNIGGLQAGTGYEFQVQGLCGTVWSAYSASTSFVTASPLCVVPGGLTISSLTTNSAVLSWNSTGASSYVLRYRAVYASNWISFNSLQTSVFLSGLTGGTNYEFQVQSICGSNFSAFSVSNVFSTVVATNVCEIPYNLSVSAITNTTANLSWNGTGATSYNLRYKTVSSVVWSNVS